MKKIYFNKIKTVLAAFCGVVAPLTLGGVGGGMLTSCSDFFNQESSDVLLADREHLNNSEDTVYSVLGIMNKLQVIADRTVLLGELRGDLVDVTSTASSDLRDVANFNVGDSNVYNAPRDYYAIINNCNYFINHADINLKSNRGENIFMKEYAAVKAFRAWTYLQLVLNYGKVPFVTQPIMSREEADADFPMYGIEEICRFFLDDLSTIPAEYETVYPSYRTIRSTDSRFFYFPINILRGDMNLWLGSITHNKEYYRQAALAYYKYITQRNSNNASYPAGVSNMMWKPGGTSWYEITVFDGNDAFGTSEAYSNTSELITMIPGDSIRAEGYYSELRNLYNSSDQNSQRVSITPSQSLFDISAAQKNCRIGTARSGGKGYNVTYAPSGLPNHLSGDLRLASVLTEGFDNTERVETQKISKFSSRNVHIYRRQMVYLRMAEALNMAGYSRAAFMILSTGLSDKIMQDSVYSYCSADDQAFLSQFKFPVSFLKETSYDVVTTADLANNTIPSEHTAIGIHSRGSGWTPLNEYYRYNDSISTLGKASDGVTDSMINVARPAAEVQAYVDSLILNEGALELAFEGTRYYDLMRYALRQSNPGATMSKFIYARRGESRRGEMQGVIRKNLNDRNSWFLKWNGKIGF